MSEEDEARAAEARMARGLTPDQEEFVELGRRLGEVRRERIRVNTALRGFDPDRPHIQELPSDAEAAVLRQRLAELDIEEVAIQAQMDGLRDLQT